MNDKKLMAIENKKCGKCNCCQAVICAYCDKVNISEEMAMNLGKAFAAGMGSTEGTCGALVGAGVVLGLMNKDKAETIKMMRNVMNGFQEKNGAVHCKQLKEKSIDCNACVADVADFLDNILHNEVQNEN